MFYPRECADSTYEIDFKAFYDRGYRGVLFDIDNTLVPHGMPADNRAQELFDRLRKTGFRTCLISNNKEPRVKPFAQEVHSEYIFDAHKPSVKNYKKAMKIMGTDITNSLFVGDQLFTDVYGANRANMYTVLVKPIHPKEEIQIVMKRYLERIVMKEYERKVKKRRN